MRDKGVQEEEEEEVGLPGWCVVGCDPKVVLTAYLRAGTAGAPLLDVYYRDPQDWV